MSWPTITYGKASWWTDCDDATGWVETEDGNTLDPMASIYGDYFDIECTASAGNKIGYESYPDEGGADNLGFSTDTYDTMIFRYKTSSASIKAKIVGVHSDASVQIWLDQTANTSWTYGTYTYTATKTLDHIRLHADAATGHVYYDFVCPLQGIFTFPEATLVELTGAFPRQANIGIPRKDGVDPQNMGSDPAQVRILANMNADVSTWNYGKVFDQISHDLSADLWQWFTSPAHKRQFKVKLADAPRYPFTERNLGLSLLLEEYKLAGARSAENYAERFGHMT